MRKANDIFLHKLLYYLYIVENYRVIWVYYLFNESILQYLSIHFHQKRMCYMF